MNECDLCLFTDRHDIVKAVNEQIIEDFTELIKQNCSKYVYEEIKKVKETLWTINRNTMT